MAQYINKVDVIAEIERRIKEYQSTGDDYWFPVIENLKNILSFLNTLEVKEVNEALRTEYEKGRADVIQATEQWLANSWPRYYDNSNIIDDYKEAIK